MDCRVEPGNGETRVGGAMSRRDNSWISKTKWPPLKGGLTFILYLYCRGRLCSPSAPSRFRRAPNEAARAGTQAPPSGSDFGPEACGSLRLQAGHGRANYRSCRQCDVIAGAALSHKLICCAVSQREMGLGSFVPKTCPVPDRTAISRPPGRVREFWSPPATNLRRGDRIDRALP
jgi:hypothetical protein